MRILAGKVLAEDAGDALNRSLKTVVGVRHGEFDNVQLLRRDRRRPRKCHESSDRAGRIQQKRSQLCGKDGNISSKLILRPLGPCLPAQW